MEFTASTIAGFLKGVLEGNPDVVVNTIARIEEGHEGALSFLANPKYEQYIYTTGSSVVLVNKDFIPSAPVKPTLIRVDDAYKAFAALLTLVDQSKPRKKGIHPSAVIEPTVKVGSDVYVGPYSCVGENCEIGDGCVIYPHVIIGDNTRIGKNTTLYANVTIYHNCIIGESCTIHSGTVIGSDGFGFAPQSESEFMKIPQLGNVVIEDRVEIGANVAVDRATIGSTIIRKGVKLDNLIQIGHNVEVGENTVMAGQCGIAGSTKIGKNCMLAGQVGLVGHLKIADGTRIGGKSAVHGDIRKENTTVTGAPAFEHRDFLRSSVIFRRLPDLYAQVQAMGKDIDALKRR
ncbi:MAG: UDP-3-O-(3-hydroxymyristoyl)glucosamine N-acyltransferase [Bacteroidales bacterium]|nr:UDP-3-O-(3-hydroxymyristoyl)glucosamine N-acyltransferase [Bacteroidales bacterium]